jgi:hypothetical protein
MTNLQYAHAVNTLLAVAHPKWDSAPIFKQGAKRRAMFVSQLAYALQGKEILYATVDYDEANGTIDALAFTAEAVVWTNYAVSGDELETEVMSTNQIEAIAVTSAPDYFAGADDAPKLVRGRVTIAGNDFNLPGDDSASTQNHQELAVFLTRLLP